MAYFDNLGNELIEISSNGMDIDNRRKAYVQPMAGSIRVNAEYIWNTYKPIKSFTLTRQLKSQTYEIKDLVAVKNTLTNEPISQTALYTVEYTDKQLTANYGYARISFSNNYNTEKDNKSIPIGFSSTDIGCEVRIYGQVGIKESKPIGTQYIILKGNISNVGAYKDIEWITNDMWFGGATASRWNDIPISFIDLEERDLDPSSTTTSGGGYGTGHNDTDSVSIPTLPALNINVTGSSLYALTQSEMLAFSAYLWNSDWQDNIKKLRNDPMQNIIGVSVCDIILTGSSSHIYLGNLDTEKIGTLINNWISLDCGEITLNEYYGSFADYEPYITLTLYLPKVGFVQIPADAVVNNTIKVVYNIELCSGEGICFVYITNKRDGFSYVYNTYTCHVTANVALSASDHTQQLSALINAGINTTTAIAGAIASGGATAGNAAMTVATSALDVATTKNPTVTTGNIGNMGSMMCVKKPYLMINRTNLTKPSSFRENNGQLINYTAKISGHTGFLKTRDFHAEFDAPYSHKVELERLMNEGVFING